MAKASIKKNFAYQMVYEILILILPFVTSPYIARVLGAESIGIYSYTYSVAYYFVLFAMLGLKNYGNRAIAQVREDKQVMSRVFWEIYTLHAGISVLCALAYIVYVAVWGGDTSVYAWIQTAYVLSAFFDISWFYFGIEKFKTTVTRNVIIRLLNVSCIFLFVRGVHDLWKYCLIMALGNLLSQIVLWLTVGQEIDFVKPDWERMRRHLQPMLILFIPAVAVSLYKYMDKIMLGTMASKAQLGLYENSEKVVNIPVTVIASFGTVMLPKMSNLAANKAKKATRRYLDLSMEFVMFLAVALACGLLGVGNVFSVVFWGQEFTHCGTLIMGLCITLPFIAFANVLRTQYLIPRERDKTYLLSVCAGAVVNLVINALLIPSMGADGAVIGTICAEVTVCVIQTVSLLRELPIGRYLRQTLYFLGAGGVMCAVVYWLGEAMGVGVLTLVVQIAAGGLLYMAFGCVYFIRTNNEIVIKLMDKALTVMRKK